MRLCVLVLQCVGIHYPAIRIFFKHSELAVVVDRYLKDLWNGRQGEIFESPVRTSLWSCDVDHVMDTLGIFNGISIDFTPFGMGIG